MEGIEVELVFWSRYLRKQLQTTRTEEGGSPPGEMTEDGSVSTYPDKVNPAQGNLDA